MIPMALLTALLMVLPMVLMTVLMVLLCVDGSADGIADGAVCAGAVRSGLTLCSKTTSQLMTKKGATLH